MHLYTDEKVQHHSCNKVLYPVGFFLLSLICLWNSKGRGEPQKSHRTTNQGKQPARICLANDRKNRRGKPVLLENTFPGWKGIGV